MKESMVLVLSDAVLRDAGIDDIDDICTIEKLSFGVPWTRDAFYNEFTINRCARYRVAVLDGKIIAYGGMWMMLDEAHITNIAVHPEFRGEGFGGILMKDIIETAKSGGMQSMTLEVRAKNTAALNLYKKYNFQEVAVRKGYYHNPDDDAIIMWKYDLQE